MEILNVYLEEQLLIKYYKIKHLILLKIQITMDISMDLLQWFIMFFVKRLWVIRPRTEWKDQGQFKQIFSYDGKNEKKPLQIKHKDKLLVSVMQEQAEIIIKYFEKPKPNKTDESCCFPSCTSFTTTLLKRIWNRVADKISKEQTA